jgi:hypothetical protein
MRAAATTSDLSLDICALADPMGLIVVLFLRAAPFLHAFIYNASWTKEVQEKGTIYTLLFYILTALNCPLRLSWLFSGCW